MIIGSFAGPFVACNIFGLLVEPRIWESGLSPLAEKSIADCGRTTPLPLGLLSGGDRVDGEVALDAIGMGCIRCSIFCGGDTERGLKCRDSLSWLRNCAVRIPRSYGYNSQIQVLTRLTKLLFQHTYTVGSIDFWSNGETLYRIKRTLGLCRVSKRLEVHLRVRER